MHASRTPSTPTKGNADLLAFYDKDLCRLIDFNLPYALEVSPNNSAQSNDGRIVNHFNYLFYQGRPELDKVLRVLAAHDPVERTKAYLFDILSETVRQVQLSKVKSPISLSTPETGSRMSASGSGRGNRAKLSKASTSKNDRRERTDERDDRDEADLMPPPCSPTLAIKHNTALTTPGLPIPPLQKMRVDKSLTTSAMTSFTSTKKSFASVFSDMKASQETVATIATSDDEEIILEAPPVNGIERSHNHAPVLEAVDQSTGVLDYRIRNIPDDGIACDLPTSMLKLPYPLRIAAYRAFRHSALSKDEFDTQWRYPRTSETLLSFVSNRKTRKSKPLVIASEVHCRERPLIARLVWSKSDDRIFELELEPHQNVIPNIYERHFGAHRFLIVDSCQINRPIGRFKNSSKEIEEKAIVMLGREQSLLGRTWVQFLPKDRKRGRDFSNDPDSSAPSTYKLFFFATCGDGLEPISMMQLIHWYIPLHLNLDQPVSKLFARLDLALSRGTPACTFNCSQIRYGNSGLPDVKSNDVPEAWSNRWTYDDQKREVEFGDKSAHTENIMSDGCARISIAAMDRVKKALGLTHRPTAVQGRIFGAKGVWYCADEELPNPVTPDDLWIDITQSQVKVRRDINAETDEELRSLEWRYPRTSETLLSFVSNRKTRKSKPLVIASEVHCRERPLIARLVWSKSDDRIFELELEPHQNVIPNIYERHFGAHRFLIVDSCQINRPIGRFKNSSKEIEEKAIVMLGREQSLLGRTWVQFLPKDRKRGRDFSNDPDSSAPSTYKLFFFATCGDGLEPISMMQLIHWYIPLHLNLDQPVSKLFARLDLALSRGTPACTFNCSQIRYGNSGLPDVKSNDVPEAWSNRWTYDDQKREVEFGDKSAHTENIMSDGCARISIAAMDRVKKALGLTHRPTAVQGRIFGAKGVWYCADEELPNPVTPDDLWIDITQSQVKVRRDINAETDEELRSLEVLKYTHKLSTSYLYTGFMPIMVHRGVPQQTILDIAGCHITATIEELMNALQDPSLLHRWLHVNRDLVNKREREMERWLANKSINDREERVLKMLEHGLRPTENKFLGEEVAVTVQWLLDREVKNTKIPVFQSTSAIGIPDLSGSLNPGEIQVNFSEAIYDPTSDRSWSTLQDMDVLIARNPSQRDSDIQKVRAVRRRELSHLRDVIIFSTQGRRPLASKLSGGDYDGDTFVVYWDQKLVRPFRNAPAPEQLTPLEDMFISVDRKKLRDIVPSVRLGPIDDSEICAFIRRQSAARMQFSYLGTISNAYRELTYPNNDLSTVTANKYNDLHDYLVDADKNGYTFLEADFIRFRQRYGASRHGEPQYRIFLKTKEKGYSDLQVSETPNKSERWTHILDKLYLDVLKREVVGGMRGVKKCLRAAMSRDTDLERPYDQVWKPTEVSSVLKSELESLKRNLDDLVVAWQVGNVDYHATGRQPEVWTHLITSLRMRYRTIKPVHPDHAAVAEWCRPQGNDLTMWDKLKASTLAKLHHQKYKMIYNVALDDLCRIKLQVAAHRSIIMPVYVHMRSRKRKSDETPEDLRDASDAESDYGDSESLFYILDDFGRDETVSPEIPRTPSSRKRVLRGFRSPEEI
nr:rna-dependent rna polymerase 1 [Quercus suber]